MNLVFAGLFGLPFLLVVGLVLLVLAGKNEPDEMRERPTALYLAFMTLTGVLLLLSATYLTANGLMELTDTTPNGGWSMTTGESVTVYGGDDFMPPGQVKRAPSRPPNRPPLSASYGESVNHDDDVSQVVGGLIAGAVALALLWFHMPKLQQAADDSVGPGARIYARLLYIVSGAALLTGLAAAAAALYSVYGMVAPDTAGAGETTDALRSFISAGALAAVAAFVFLRAWSRSEDLAAVLRPAPPVEPAE